MRYLLGSMIFLVSGSVSGAEPHSPTELRNDAASIERLVNRNYAYLERMPGGNFILSAKLKKDGERIASKQELISFSERALFLLADHHAITGSSTVQSWAVFPSFGDLWIGPQGGSFVIEEVRRGSPADEAGIRAGDRLTAVDGVATALAVKAFWAEIGTTGGGERDGYAARVLAAGRCDRARSLTLQRGSQSPRTVALQNLYRWKRADRPPVSVGELNGDLIIRINDALSSDATIAVFDAAVARARPDQRLVVDLTETPSGGNTTIARAILGWFVTKPTSYQIHDLPAEERRTGVARQWVEQVLPRRGRYHAGQVVGAGRAHVQPVTSPVAGNAKPPGRRCRSLRTWLSSARAAIAPRTASSVECLIAHQLLPVSAPPRASRRRARRRRRCR